jgi:hypothetical protein
MAITYSAKGTSFPSFKIYKNGPTFYQGTADPAFSAQLGDLYVQHTAESKLWIYKNTGWAELGVGGAGNISDFLTISSSYDGSAKQIQFILSGTTSDDTESELFVKTPEVVSNTLLQMHSSFSSGGTTYYNYRIAIPNDTVAMIEARVVGRDSVNSDHAGYRLTGVAINNSGSTMLIADPIEEIIAETTTSWIAVIEADDVNDAVSIKVTGAAASDVKWTAFVSLTYDTQV